jgi:FkbM family methyltransferase
MIEATQDSVFPTFRMLGKASRHLNEHGPASFFRETVWRLHYERLQWLKRRRARRHQTVPSAISFQGKDFELHPSLAGLSEELLMFGIHEPLATRLYLENLSPGAHVLDVGANIGYYPLVTRRAIGSSGRLLGFEPAPDVFEILKRNLQMAGTTNVEVFPWAIGAKTELAQFHLSEVPNWGSLIRDETLLPTRSIDVEVKRIDDIVQRFPGFHPTVLRMDVEGGELMVLRGAEDTLREFRPTLFIEVHTFALGWEAVRSEMLNLRHLGYSSAVVIERTWDEPWISKWMRERRYWSGTTDELVRRMESPKDPLVAETFGLILKRPCT